MDFFILMISFIYKKFKNSFRPSKKKQKMNEIDNSSNALSENKDFFDDERLYQEIIKELIAKKQKANEIDLLSSPNEDVKGLIEPLKPTPIDKIRNNKDKSKVISNKQYGNEIDLLSSPNEDVKGLIEPLKPTLIHKPINNNFNKNQNEIINKLNNQKLVKQYKSIVAEFSSLSSEQNKNNSVVKKLNSTAPALNKTRNNQTNNALLEEILKVKSNLRKVEPTPRMHTQIINPQKISKTTISNWQREQIKTINKQIKSIDKNEPQQQIPADREENTR